MFSSEGIGRCGQWSHEDVFQTDQSHFVVNIADIADVEKMLRYLFHCHCNDQV
jgi:hypothetical protein